MPRPRRASRYLRPGELTPFQRAWLLDVDDDELPERDSEDNAWYYFERGLDFLPSSAAGLWRAHRDVLLAVFVRDHPGTRPSTWWHVDAPEMRRQVGGQGEFVRPEYWCGMPHYWTRLDPLDPPKFEAEASYLKRHRLFLPGEERRLTEADFQPEAGPALCESASARQAHRADCRR
jgi:hypothetical protein